MKTFLILTLQGLLILASAKGWSITQVLSGPDTVNHSLGYRHQVEADVVLLENKRNLLPLMSLDTLRIASLSLGEKRITPFQEMLANYAPVDYYTVPVQMTGKEILGLKSGLIKYNLVIVGVYDNFINDTTLRLLSELKNSVYVCFASTGFIGRTHTYLHPEALLMACSGDTLTQQTTAQMVFGGICISGRLKEDIAPNYARGAGISLDKAIRLKYTVPEEEGMDSRSLTYRVDSVLNDAIDQKAFPGCNILVAKDGKIIFQKAYGYHTYENIVPASINDIYDLASVSKVSGGLPAIMKLYDEGKIALDEKFSTYYTDWKKGFLHTSNKEDLTLRELLAHQAGLTPFIPFYKRTITNGILSSRYYRADKEKGYSLEVAPGLYLKDDFRNYVYKTIRLSPVKNRGKYVYSDLFFVMAPEFIRTVTGREFTRFLDSCFYKPLGATTITYQAFKKFSADRIVPTENDNYYRKRQIIGSVHDESSAVLGGISGNAGLFASANDLAKLLQMYLQMGSYGGKQYLKESTLKEFNRVQFPQNNNRRALGFDKPLPGNDTLSFDKAYPSPLVSSESFGHSGYTGTFFWVDPKYQLVYILLTNRVYPTRDNNKLSDLSIRSKVQQIIYEEMLNRK